MFLIKSTLDQTGFLSIDCPTFNSANDSPIQWAYHLTHDGEQITLFLLFKMGLIRAPILWSLK